MIAAADAAPGPGRAPWSLRGGAVVLCVRLTPKSSHDEIGGVGYLSNSRPFLKARVRAAPQDGAANAALIKLVAKSLRIPAAAVRLESGATARLKTLVLIGDANDLAAAVIALSAPARG